MWLCELYRDHMKKRKESHGSRVQNWEEVILEPWRHPPAVAGTALTLVPVLGWLKESKGEESWGFNLGSLRLCTCLKEPRSFRQEKRRLSEPRTCVLFAFSISTEENIGIWWSWKYFLGSYWTTDLGRSLWSSVPRKSLKWECSSPLRMHRMDLGPDQAHGRSHMDISGGLSLSLLFPGSVQAITAEFPPPSAESLTWTQGNDLLWKRQSSDSFRPWAEGPTVTTASLYSHELNPVPYMESEVLTVSCQIMPLSLFSHYPEYHRQILVILQSLEIRFLCLWIQTFLTHPGYTKPEALHNMESKVVLPSLQMVQHWIFK